MLIELYPFWQKEDYNNTFHSTKIHKYNCLGSEFNSIYIHVILFLVTIFWFVLYIIFINYIKFTYLKQIKIICVPNQLPEDSLICSFMNKNRQTTLLKIYFHLFTKHSIPKNNFRWLSLTLRKTPKLPILLIFGTSLDSPLEIDS